MDLDLFYFGFCFIRQNPSVATLSMGHFSPFDLENYEDQVAQLKWIFEPSLQKFVFEPDQDAKVREFWNK